MGKRIRVMIADDSEDDALLLVDELQENGFEPDFIRVDTSDAMVSALGDGTWDIIIADYLMPGFSGSEALKILQNTGLDIPFILVSGTAQETTGVEVMRLGAQDFIMKHSLSRLAPAVSRELAEVESRRKRRQAEEERRESEERYRLITETAHDAIITADEEGTILLANPAAEQIFGYTADEMVGRSITMLMPERYRARSMQALRRYLKSGEKRMSRQDVEVTGVHKSGREIPLETSYSDYVMRGRRCFTGTFRDITDRKLAEQREREREVQQREFYRRTILAATDGKLLISDREEIESIACCPVGSWDVTDVNGLTVMRDDLGRIISEEGMDESQAPFFLGCVVEAAANAIKHASGGRARLCKNDDGFVFIMSDSGPGIQALALPDVALTRGYSTAGTLGMGYKMMIRFADKVRLATGPEGTVVAIEMGMTGNPEQTAGERGTEHGI